MPGEPKKLNHPGWSYLIGSVFLMLTLVVLVGVIHHLTISSHGPGLLMPLLKEYREQRKSEIFTEARRHAEIERHRHFHNVAPKYPRLPENLRPVCFICHSELPHSKNKRIRSLMNLHTQFLACETCHIKVQPGATIVYKWYNPLERNPKGPFYGTSYDPVTGILSPGKDPLARIAPFIKKDHTLDLAIQVQDAPLAQDFIKVRDKLSPEQREGIKNKFHENIKPKGYGCKTCHTENSILDFAQLGFSETRTTNLKQLIFADMLAKYEEFYLPELFIEKVPEGAEKTEKENSD